jgi:hypothetical protein
MRESIMSECYYMLLEAGIISTPHPKIRDNPDNKEN